MTQSLIREMKQNWKPSFTGASLHVRLVIKEYSQLDKLVFHKQIDVTLRGLITAGFTHQVAYEIVYNELIRGGFSIVEWLNGRSASEIIANN